ncbi:hypothetical protein D3C71_2126940 [compost metagenome]
MENTVGVAAKLIACFLQNIPEVKGIVSIGIRAGHVSELHYVRIQRLIDLPGIAVRNARLIG